MAALTITDALRILQAAPRSADPFHLVLVCGFTPLHLKTLIGAHIQRRLPQRLVQVETGLYGDLAGTLEALATTSSRERRPETAVMAIEWQDLDPRLGFREGGRWIPGALRDILATVRASLDRLSRAIEALPPGFRLAVALPGLPLPPIFHAATVQTTVAEALLDEAIAHFGAGIADHPGAALVNARSLAVDSPPGSRYDFKSDLLTGLPYKIHHADVLASALAALAVPAPPKKGLITDLDDTLWHGLVGELGPEGVSWDAAGHHQIHALYQKLLSSLSEEGVLIGIASKNDAATVDLALRRRDLFIPPDRIFPVEVHWQAKSGSVGRILSTWNVAADSVVFVDDNPMELAEVAEQHPGIECLLFPRDDYAAAWNLLLRLRSLFGRERLLAEDALRLDSIRRGAEFRTAAADGEASEGFLQAAEAMIEFDFAPGASDARLLELVNKTNQFNLNGRRYTEAEWHQAVSAPGAFLAGVSYEDKFGPLGKIAVIFGVREGKRLRISGWVMSCRAFARRIEHQTLRTLLDRYDVESLIFDFVSTLRNSPLQDFFERYRGTREDGSFELTREQLESSQPPLYHRTGILEHNNTSRHG